MPYKLIERLEKQGKLKKQKSGIVQTEALLKDAILDLKEAKKIYLLAARATYLLAYIAMLKAGRALLLLKGYVPIDGVQHKTVVDVTAAILGDDYKNLTAQFENMRRKRNELTYEPGSLLSKSESEKAFKDAVSLVKNIIREASAVNPKIQLKFDSV